MITLTFQFTDIASASALLAKLNGAEQAAIVGPAPSPKPEAEPQARAPSPRPSPKPEAEKTAKASDAPTAPSPRTAEAAPSQPADPTAPAAAPATPTEATPPAAAAPSAPVDDKPFDYTVLQKAVNERVAKFGKDALLAIATKHGAATFKALDASKWAAAHADVVALG